MTLKPKRARVEKIQLYFCRDVEEEKLALDVWNASLANARPQEVFRNIVTAGIKALAESGRLPPSIMRKLPNPPLHPVGARPYRPETGIDVDSAGGDGFYRSPRPGSDGYDGSVGEGRGMPPTGHSGRSFSEGRTVQGTEMPSMPPKVAESANRLSGLLGLMGAPMAEDD